MMALDFGSKVLNNYFISRIQAMQSYQTFAELTEVKTLNLDLEV